MNMRKTSALALAAAGILATGCRDDVIASPNTAPPVATVLVASASLESRELQLAPRFALSLAVTESGPSLQVVTRVQGLRATASAQIALTAPDLVLEAARPLGGVRAAAASVMRPLAERRRALGVGDVDETKVVIARPMPGYYRFYLTASAGGVTERDVSGQTVQSQAAESYWLFVTPNRVTVTREFDATLFGDSLQAVPGPFTPRRQRAPRADTSLTPAAASTSAETARGTTATMTSTIDRQRIRLVYWNIDANPDRFDPVVGAYINVRRYDDYYQTDTHYGVLTTDANGEVSIPCSYDSPFVSYYWDARGENNDVNVIGGLYASQTVYGGCTASTLELPVVSDTRAHAFKNFRELIPLTRSFFGQTRAKVKVELMSSITISDYRTSTDGIRLVESGTNAAVWDSYGRFVQAHEYGHALHEKAFGGIRRPSNSGQGFCPSSHFFGLYWNLGCAWVEGFASYVAWAVWTAEIGDPTWAPGDGNPWRNPAQRGTIGEADVAAFLYDVTDPSNEIFDAVAMPGSYLRNLMVACKVNQANVDAVDYLIGCLERAPYDWATYSQFFAEGGLRLQILNLTAGTPDLGGATPAQVRTLWRWNLFSL